MSLQFPQAAIDLGRQLNEANLPDTCDVEMPVAVDDGEGGALVSWEAESEGVACRVSPLGSPEERIAAGMPVEDQMYSVVFAAKTELPVGCRLRVTSGTEDLLLDPMGSDGPRTYEMLRRYDCRAWKGRAEEGPS